MEIVCPYCRQIIKKWEYNSEKAAQIQALHPEICQEKLVEEKKIHSVVSLLGENQNVNISLTLVVTDNDAKACKPCNLEFGSEDLLDQHLKINHMVYKCQKCPNLFESKITFLDHHCLTKVSL